MIINSFIENHTILSILIAYILGYTVGRIIDIKNKKS